MIRERTKYSMTTLNTTQYLDDRGTKVSRISLFKWLTLIGPVLSPLFLALATTMAALGTGQYLGYKPQWLTLCTYGSIVFLVYTINRFTDKEDLINDPDSKLVFSANRWILFLAITASAILLIFSAFYQQLSWYYILIIAIGIIYSIRLIPVYDSNQPQKFIFLRIKDIPFLKSVTVSITMGSSFFLVHIISVQTFIAYNIETVSLFVTSLIFVFINTNFCDIKDYTGDKATNVQTLPTTFGIKNTIIYALFLPAFFWLLLIGLFYSQRLVSGQAFAVHIINMIFPVAYFLLYFMPKRKINPSIMTIVADSCALVFGASMLWLAHVQSL